MRVATSTELAIGPPAVGRSRSERAALCGFVLAAAALFALSATATVASSISMSAMGTLPMPGGWSMSRSWIAPCGSSTVGALPRLVAMWLAMTVTMMLPSVAPALWRYGCGARRDGAGSSRVVVLTGAFAAGYFATWAVLGALAQACGTWFALSALASRSLARALPYLAAALVMAAGALEASAWRARYLRCTRAPPRHTRARSRTVPAAAADGLRFGWHCACCCAPPMAVMLVAGNSDIAVIVAATLAITAERLAPCPERVARAYAVLALAAGGALLFRTILWR